MGRRLELAAHLLDAIIPHPTPESLEDLTKSAEKEKARIFWERSAEMQLIYAQTFHEALEKAQSSRTKKNNPVLSWFSPTHRLSTYEVCLQIEDLPKLYVSFSVRYKRKGERSTAVAVTASSHRVDARLAPDTEAITLTHNIVIELSSDESTVVTSTGVLAFEADCLVGDYITCYEGSIKRD